MDFSMLKTAIVDYKRELAEIDAEYDDYATKAEKQAEQIRPEIKKQWLKDRLKEMKAKARESVLEADARFTESLTKAAKAMSGELTKDVQRPMSNALRTNLSDIRAFDIQVNRDALAALLPLADGNILGLSAIDALARKNGFKTTLPSLAELSADVACLEEYARLQGPRSYFPESCNRVREYAPCPVQRDESGNVIGENAAGLDALGLLAERYTMGWMEAHIDDMETRWDKTRRFTTADFLPGNFEKLDKGEQDEARKTADQERKAAIEQQAEAVEIVEPDGTLEAVRAMSPHGDGQTFKERFGT